jgi:hypothetical protein
MLKVHAHCWRCEIYVVRTASLPLRAPHQHWTSGEGGDSYRRRMGHKTVCGWVANFFPSTVPQTKCWVVCKTNVELETVHLWTNRTNTQTRVYQRMTCFTGPRGERGLDTEDTWGKKRHVAETQNTCRAGNGAPVNKQNKHAGTCLSMHDMFWDSWTQTACFR